MKKVVVTGQNEVELQDAELDENPGQNELLIETERSFISAGTELSIYTGKEEKALQPGNWCTYPFEPGYANIGIVVAGGKGAPTSFVGKRVFTFGKHASLIRMNMKRLVIEVPADIDPSIAAASRMAAVAATAPLVSEISMNPWVVVFGLGMVGNLAAQMYQQMGCRVIGVDLSEARCRLARSCGIPHTVSGTPEQVSEAIRDITEGRLAQISVDAVGHSQVVMQALRSTAKFGQLILLGSPRVPVQGNMTELLSDVHLRLITLRGALEWAFPTYSELPNVQTLYAKQETIFNWIREGKLAIEPLISHHFQPEDIKTAYDSLLQQPDIFTGVVFDWK